MGGLHPRQPTATTRREVVVDDNTYVQIIITTIQPEITHSWRLGGELLNRIWTWVILLRLLLSIVGASIITVYCAFVSTNVIIVIIKRQVFRVCGNKKASPLQSTRKRRRRTVVTIECNYSWRALVFCKITVQIERVGGGGGARKELLSDKTRIKFKVDLTTISSTRSYYYNYECSCL